jgi:hypothetical protein
MQSQHTRSPISPYSAHITHNLHAHTHTTADKQLLSSLPVCTTGPTQADKEMIAFFFAGPAHGGLGPLHSQHHGPATEEQKQKQDSMQTTQPNP